MNPKLIVAASIVAAQSLVIWALLAQTGVAIITGDISSITSALFLAGLMLAAGIWSLNVAIGLFRKRRWAHTPGLILQLLVASIGTASFGGEFGIAWLGWLLLLPAALTFYLLFSKTVRAEFDKD